MIKSTPPNPYRFELYLPKGYQATTPEEALNILSAKYGSGSEESLSNGLSAITFHDEDKNIAMFKDIKHGNFVAIQSQLNDTVQMFFRPCSGWRGGATTLGRKSGNILFIMLLIAGAFSKAMSEYGRLRAAVPNICRSPCVMLPIGPYPSNFSITVTKRIFGIPTHVTIRIDLKWEFLCI